MCVHAEYVWETPAWLWCRVCPRQCALRALLGHRLVAALMTVLQTIHRQQSVFTITEKAVKLGRRHKHHTGWVGWLA